MKEARQTTEEKLAKSFIKLQLFAEEGAAEGAGTATATETTAETDYKALYEAEQAEKQRLKTALDRSNSENAAYKKKERERMTQEEQTAADAKAREEELVKLRQEITEGKVEKIFVENGIEEATYKAMIAEFVPFLTAEQAVALSKSIASAIAKAKGVAAEQKKNESIVNGVVHPGSESSKDSGAGVDAFVKEMLGNQDMKKLEENKNTYKL